MVTLDIKPGKKTGLHARTVHKNLSHYFKLGALSYNSTT